MADDELTNAQGDPAAEAQPDQTGVTPTGTQGEPAANDTADDRKGLHAALKAERDARQQAERELKKRDAEIKKQERAQLEKAGEYQKLYEDQSAELEVARADAERVRQLEGAMEASNQLRIEGIPETMRGLVPDHYTAVQKAQWLDKNAAQLSLPASPNLNAGAGQGVPAQRNGRLTADEMAAAQQMGVDPADALRTKQLMAGAPIQPGDFGPPVERVQGMVQPPNVLGVQGVVQQQGQQPAQAQAGQNFVLPDPHSEPRGT